MAGRGSPAIMEKGENGIGYSGVTFVSITCRINANSLYLLKP
jgi:hypothetical protein